jgi:twitching motility two-component system response regulator PilH
MGTILVVDDHPDTRDVVGEMLEMHGHSVTFAESVDAAWNKITAAAPDAVIVDMRLPGGFNGTELLKRVRQSPALSKLPVVLCSGDDIERENPDTHGAWEFWLKGSDDVFEGIARLTKHLTNGG